MATLNKALTRPANIKGIPLVPLTIVCGAITLLSVYTSYWLLFLLIPALIEMKNKARKDIHYFSLKLLELKTRGRKASQRFYGANVISSNQYGDVDVREFNEKMRLNESINISKYIPYSSHIHERVIRNRRGDLVSTWEIGGTIFECEEESHLTHMTMQLNNLIRTYEGLPFTFYIHRIRESFTDTFEANSGKSTLLEAIKHLAQKYRREASFSPAATHKRLTTVSFDKDRSAEMSIRQMGGRYFRIRSGESTGWNPFSLAPTKRNLNFIKQLIRMLCTRDGKPLDPRDEERISQAVNTIMLDYPPEYRHYGITRLLEVLPEPPTKEARTNGLRIRLKQWAKSGEFGWVFDNDVDTFNIDECDNFGIDGTEFLDDKDVCAPITFYLLYRVTSLLDGRRLIMFMDEFWKWLADKEFSKFALNMLKVIRKLNGIFVPATQSPEEMAKSEISAAIIEQCGTQIFMANPKAAREDYVDKLKVPDSVFNIVKELDPGARQMVILKTPLRRGETRSFISLAKLDLSGLGKYTKILSASEDNLKIFDSIWHEDMQPEDWKQEFLQKCI